MNCFRNNDAVFDAYDQLAEAQGLLPVKVTPFYRAKVEEEIAALGHAGGPLARIVYPVEERFGPPAPGEVKDWVGDGVHAAMEGGFIVHKYRDRVLFLPTGHCAAHCLYCFRGPLLPEMRDRRVLSLDDKLAALRAHLFEHEEVTEVILSGGDPLMLPAGDLEKTLAAIRGVRTEMKIRLHTRAPVFAPGILTQDKLSLLAAQDVRVRLHIVHPYEVCEEIAAALRRMQDAGLRLASHFPLLRGVNDHVEVLDLLYERLAALGAPFHSVYVPEPVPYSAAYRLAFRRARGLVEDLRRRNPGADFRFCLDTKAGKVEPHHMMPRESAGGKLIFLFEGQRVEYPDFPESRDAPGAVEMLLWRSRAQKCSCKDCLPG